METWRPVINARGEFVEGYQVSSRGRMRSFVRMGRAEWTPRPRLKATFPDDGGFLNVTLRDGPRGCFRYAVHQLVALAFVGPRPSRSYVVIHLNHDRADNRVENLAWVTRSEATRHSMTHRPRRGIHARFTPATVRAIRRSPLEVKDLATKYGVTVQTIYAIIKYHTWKDVD